MMDAPNERMSFAWPMTVNDLYILTGYLEDQVEDMSRDQRIIINFYGMHPEKTFVTIDKQGSAS
jgi:hypothetical protein